MIFSLELASVSKKNIIGRNHIKSIDNMHSKTKTNDLDGKISKNYPVF
jgi:hypothetical protein